MLVRTHSHKYGPAPAVSTISPNKKYTVATYNVDIVRMYGEHELDIKWEIVTKKYVHLLYSDNSLVFVGLITGPILVLDILTGKEVGALLGHRDEVTQMVIHDHRLFTCSKDRTIRVWDIKTRMQIRKLEEHRDVVTSIVVNGNTLISGSRDHNTITWDLGSGEWVAFKRHPHTINYLVQDGTRMAAIAGGNRILIWDTNSDEYICDKIGVIHCMLELIAFFGKYLITLQMYGVIRLYDIELGKFTTRIQVPHIVKYIKPISSDTFECFSTHGRTRVRLWDYKLSLFALSIVLGDGDFGVTRKLWDLSTL